MSTTKTARRVLFRSHLFRPTNAFPLFALALALGFALTAFSPAAFAVDEAGAAPHEMPSFTLDTAPPMILAQSGGDAGRSQPLEPRYQPREPEPKSWYDDSYIFALTRSVADSTIAPAGQVPLYVLTVPLDIVLLPFALIGGLFG